MHYDFSIDHRAVVKHEAADALSRQLTKRTDESDINDEILIMVIATRALIKLSEIQEHAPKETHDETNEPQRPTVDECMST